jgi:hypothetical protein
VVNSKAIKVLKQLNKEEFHKLEKFFLSPYFNTNKKMTKLYKLLKKFYPEFISIKFTKENIFRAIYENECYNDEKMRKLFSDLYKELEKFLVSLQLDHDRIMYNKLLLRVMDTKKLDNLFLLKYDEANEFLDKMEFNYGYYLEKFLLQWHYVSFHLDRGKQQKIAPNILDRGNYSTLFYLSDFFLTINDMTSNKEAYGVVFASNLTENFENNFDFESFFENLERINILNKEFVKIYYYAYLAYKYFNEEDYYYKLEKYVFDNLEKLSKLGQINALMYLINFCYRKINMGSEKFRHNLNEIYRIYIQRKLLIREEEGYVRSDLFLQIIENFIQVGKIGELKAVLKKNINFFYPEHKESILYYNSAMINFSRGEYNNALKELIRIKTSSPLFDTRTKRLILKIFYEQQRFEEAGASLKNFKRFLIRCKSLSELRREQLIEFTDDYNELLKARIRVDDGFNIAKLKKQFSPNHHLIDSEWLNEKIKELESKIVTKTFNQNNALQSHNQHLKVKKTL